VLDTRVAEDEGTPVLRDQVFVSYCRDSDTAFARRLTQALKAVPFNVWLDEEQIPPGDDFERRLQKVLEECRHAIFVVSKEWLEREWTRYEAETFAEKGAERRRIAVLRFPRGAHDVGPRLKLLQNVEWIDGQSDEAACFWQVVCGLTGEPPGPVADWAPRGQALLDRLQGGARPPSPAGAAPQPRRRAPEPRDRDGLYLSCDRGDQWSYLTDLLQRHPRQHQLLLLPGPRGEAHDEFLKRIESRLPPDPPRRIVTVTWSEYPCPRQAELLLADVALALDADERTLATTLRGELGRGQLILLQPSVHCFGPAALDYATRLLPSCLREAGTTRFALKVVQPIEWPVRRLGVRMAGWLKAIVGSASNDAEAEAAAFMAALADHAGPELPVVGLPKLQPIVAAHLEAFCEANNLRRDRRAAFIADVLRDAHNSRDVLFNVQRLFPIMELS